LNFNIQHSVFIIQYSSADKCTMKYHHGQNMVFSCPVVYDHAVKIVFSCPVVYDHAVKIVFSCPVVYDHAVKIVFPCPVVYDHAVKDFLPSGILRLATSAGPLLCHRMPGLVFLQKFGKYIKKIIIYL